MSQDNTKPSFRHYYGTEEIIKALPKVDGSLYFATDKGSMYVDINGQRYSISGSGGGGNTIGSSIVYASIPSTEQTEDENKYYIMPFSAIKDETLLTKIKVDDLIINEDEGAFYRVMVIDNANSVYYCTMMALSGESGGSSGSNFIKGSLTASLSTAVDIVNNSECEIIMTALSAIEDDIPIQLTGMKVDISFVEFGTTTVYWSDTITIGHNETYHYPAGDYLRTDAETEIHLTLRGSSRNQFVQGGVAELSVTTHSLDIGWSTEFSNSTYKTTSIVPYVKMSDGANRILDIYFDDALVYTKEYSATTTTKTQSITITKDSPIYDYETRNKTDYTLSSNSDGMNLYTHGSHKIKAQLSLVVNKARGAKTELIEKEIGLLVEDKPLIWINDYQSQYYDYETPVIEFKVYTPGASSSSFYLLKNNVDTLDGNARTCLHTNENWETWEITGIDAATSDTDFYTIRTGTGDNITVREFRLNVVEDPRHMGVVTDGLVVDFSARGRSNTEAKAKRETLLIGDKNATFTNFNWYNNGWIMDENKTTCLRVSNGASVTFPIGSMIFAGGSDTTSSKTFELQFKIKNVQDYTTLVTNYTLYKDGREGKDWTDEEVFEMFKAQRNNPDGFNNYDAYLAYILPELQKTNPEIPSYEDLTYRALEKVYNLDSAIAVYMTPGASVSGTPAICLGPQDVFFKNAQDAVSANYVEDELINLAIVYDHGNGTASGNDKLMKIYINGMLTSVARSQTSDSWAISADSITFYSNICDIDIYKMRVYNKRVPLDGILKNYAYDVLNTTMWDLAELTYENPDINEPFQFSYTQMLAYNKAHPSDPIMPYIVFTTDETDTISKGNLPWRKDTPITVDMEFVNTGLDAAYRMGELAEIADDLKVDVADYYLHHCPSWTAEGVRLSVQGTSSEFYPRRNYKAKTKTDKVVYDENDNVVFEAHSYTMKDGNTLSYNTPKVDDDFKMIAHKGPFEASYNAAIAAGEDPGRLKYFYYDNNTVGCNKFTLKIDFMESSGSYNMGLANLVKHAYTHHPLEDYNAAHAFSKEDPSKSDYVINTKKYDAKKTYYYLSHKGEWKVANASGNVAITSAEDFAKGPYALAMEQSSVVGNKVLGCSTGKVAVPVADCANPTVEELASLTANIAGTAANADCIAAGNVSKAVIDSWNKWFVGSVGYSEYQFKNLGDYRTSVQGFPVLAFHQTKAMKKAGIEPLFIGRYNMLLDKGADEAYGFKPSKSVLAAYKGNKAVRNIAECWEYENNSRGFCSFRDLWNRYDLSFDAPKDEKGEYKVTNALTSHGAPVIADYFEYRYNKQDDYIDLLVDYDTSRASDIARIDLGEEYDIDIANEPESGRKVLLDLYKNWEKAVQWVWKTATDATIDKDGDGNLVPIPSMGTYEVIDLYEAMYTPNTYFLEVQTPGTDSQGNPVINISYVSADGEYDPDVTYYKQLTTDDGVKYQSIKVCPPFKAVYSAGTYYLRDGDNYNISNDAFDPSKTYYEKINESTYKAIALTNNSELIGTPSGVIYEKNVYYITVNHLKVLTDAEFDSQQEYFKLNVDESGIDEFWRLPEPVENGKLTYHFDTKEYRLVKFKNELTQHFNLEYLITYFVITEVLEAYDSRGKNCMMASWGPQTAGGDYIWYPIFYDMDTQLGINNTGIPSFEYNIDATEDGSFSTNDSVLWNNLYALYKDLISTKYEQLTGVPTTAFGKNLSNASAQGALSNPPFASVDVIESFYSADPKFNDSFSMRGERPLMAFNLDEQYKYISITNPKVGHLASGTTPEVTQAGDGFFYALQGNRSMSRRQFLTNRLNYINSWLGVGDYKRGGANRIRSRMSANNAENTSDKWIEGTAKNGSNVLTRVPYYKEDGTKTHMFDGEYWLTMTPVRKMYVTVGTDAANFEPVKYSGTPVDFSTPDLENGVRNSGNYREQLYYVYGLDQMKSLGDLSKMYFQEFALEMSKASKLVDLRLGYDGLDEEGNHYKNSQVNDWSIPAQAGLLSGGLPLLREVNLSYITFKNTSLSFDFSGCEKLQNFRDVGSNIVSVAFAEGVALNTLHLGAKTASLKLVEARQLVDYIDETNPYTPPTHDAITNTLSARPGLYIENLTDKPDNKATTLLTSLTINGGGLGYNSYKLLDKFYHAAKNYDAAQSAATARKIEMTDVLWSPYTPVDDPELIYDPTEASKFYKDNGHFGFTPYTYDASTWSTDIKNGMIYTYNADDEKVSITSAQLFEALRDEDPFISLNPNESYGNGCPNLTGIVYINNPESNEYDEELIQNELVSKYPNMKFFFAHVKAGYAARYVMVVDGVETLLATDKIGADTPVTDTLRFKNPANKSDWTAAEWEYLDPEVIDARRSTYDFLGWGYKNDATGMIETYDVNWNSEGRNPIHEWATNAGAAIHEGQIDYTFYAVFEIHSYNMSFYDGDGNVCAVVKVPAGEYIGQSKYLPNLVPGKSTLSPDHQDDYEAQKFYVNKFLGWSIREGSTTIENWGTNLGLAKENRNFYGVFEEVDVANNALGDQYWDEYSLDYDGVTYYGVRPKANFMLSGKVTVPSTFNGKPVECVGGFGMNGELPREDTRAAIIANVDGKYSKTNYQVTHVFFENPDTIKIFGPRAFSNCPLLKFVQIPGSLMRIGDYAFYNAYSLRIQDFGYTKLTRIDANSFSGAFDVTTSLNLMFPGSMVYVAPTSLTYFTGTDKRRFEEMSGTLPMPVQSVTFGGVKDPSQINEFGTQWNNQNNNYELYLRVYCKEERNDFFQNAGFDEIKNSDSEE